MDKKQIKMVFLAVSFGTGSLAAAISYKVFSYRQLRKITKELDNFTKYELETKNLDPTDLLIYNTIKENQRRTYKPHFPYQYGDNPSEKPLVTIELVKRFVRAFRYDVIVLKSAISGGLVCLFSLFILYYNVDFKLKIVMTNYAILLIRTLNNRLTYDELLKTAKKRLFPKNFPLPMTRADFEVSELIDQNLFGGKLNTQMLLIKYSDLTENMNLSPKASATLLFLGIAYLRMSQKDPQDFVLFITILSRLLGFDDPNNPMK